MIHKIQGISHPRSGRALIHQIVLDYFKDQIIMPCKQKDKAYGLVKGNINWAKNHDFKQSLAKNINIKYLIQCRNPARCITSEFYLWGKMHYTFPQFARKRIVLWKYIVTHWIEAKNINTFTMWYEPLINDTENIVSDFVKFISTDKINHKRLKKIIQSLNIKPRRRLEQTFVYKEQREVLDWIEKQTKDLMKKHNVPSYSKSV